MEYKPTIEDVAKLAKVSIATVSRVINNQGGVRKVTEDRIVSAISELGYIRSAVARSMKERKQTPLVLLCLILLTHFSSRSCWN